MSYASPHQPIITKPLMIVLLFVAPLFLHAQMPRWVKSIDYNPHFTPDKQDFADGYYYLLVDEQVNIAQKEVYYHTAVKVAEESGLAMASQINITYNSAYQALTFTHVKIIRPNETIDILKHQKPEIIRREEDLEQNMITGEKTAFFKLPGVKVGDIIDYGVVTKGFNPAKADFFCNKYYLGYSSAVGKINIRTIIDQPQLYSFQLNNCEINPQIDKEGKLLINTWLVENPKVVANESDAASWFDPYPSVYIFRKKTWTDVSNYTNTLFSSKTQLSPQIKEWIETTQQSHIYKTDAALALIRDVQNKIRYLGVETGENGLKPRHPNLIFEQKAGDCKEKSWLLSQALQQIGYKAFPVLINTHSGHTLPTTPPSIEDFNHCVVCIINPNDTIWVDPTISNQGGNFFHLWFPNYEYGLIVDEQSQSLSPIEPQGEMATQVYETFQISKLNEPAVFQVETVYHGSEADSQRDNIKSQSMREIQQQYLKFYADMYPRIDTIADIEVMDDTNTNSLTIKEYYQIPNLWYASDTLKPENLRADFFPMSLKYLITHENFTKRKSPLSLRFPLTYSHHIKVLLPEEWNIKNEETTINGKGYNYHRNVTYQNNQLELLYQYSTTQAIIKPADYLNFIEQHEKIYDDLSYSLTYGNTSAPAKEGGVNALILVIGFFVVLISSYGAYKLYYYDPEVIYCYENERREPNGWILAATVLMFFQPLMILAQLVTGNFVKLSSMNTIFNPASGHYDATLGWILIVEFTIVLALLVFSALIAILMVKRRSSAPLLLIIFFSTKTVMQLFVYVICYLNPSYNDVLHASSGNSLIWVIIITLIYISYFSNSEKVKETFTNRLLKSRKIKKSMLYEYETNENH